MRYFSITHFSPIKKKSRITHNYTPPTHTNASTTRSKFANFLLETSFKVPRNDRIMKEKQLIILNLRFRIRLKSAIFPSKCEEMHGKKRRCEGLKKF